MKTFECDNCGNPVFFENDSCVKCGNLLGYLSTESEMIPYIHPKTCGSQMTKVPIDMIIARTTITAFVIG